MDSITHIALGAVVGEAIAGKQLGKRAMLIGAIAQSIPDIDILATTWLSATDNLLAHRGFTHSFLFCILVSIALAVGAQRWYKQIDITLLKWMFFFALEILLHLVLDACNAYGVGWLEPFSRQRISFNILFVADPFYTIWLVISLVMLTILHSQNGKRRFWIGFGLVISTAYFLHAVSNKIMITRETQTALLRQHIPHQRMLTTPTPLNSWLWYVVIEDKTGFYTAYRSVADDKNEAIDFTYFPKQHKLLAPFETDDATRQLKRFSQGYYTIEHLGDTVMFNDLRFGQIAGWENPKAKFAFHYYLNYPDANLLVMQRGRFSSWNRKTFEALVQRIKGHQ